MNEIPQTNDEVSEQLEYERRFKKLVNDIHTAGSPNDIMVGLQEQILNVYNVEMAAIFLVDAVKMQLVSWVLLPGNFLRKIRVPVDKTSIVGYAAATREVLIINNAYEKDELGQIDPELRFDSSWDRKAGSRTRQVLAAPIQFQRSLMGSSSSSTGGTGPISRNRISGTWSTLPKRWVSPFAICRSSPSALPQNTTCLLKRI